MASGRGDMPHAEVQKWYAERLNRDELLKGEGKGKQVGDEDPEEGFGSGDDHWTRRMKRENEELKKENEELKKQIVGDDPGDDPDDDPDDDSDHDPDHDPDDDPDDEPEQEDGDDESLTSEDEDMLVRVRMPDGKQTVRVITKKEHTIYRLKSKVSKVTGIPVRHIRLMLEGLQIEDGHVADYDFKDNTVLGLSLRLGGGGKRARCTVVNPNDMQMRHDDADEVKQVMQLNIVSFKQWLVKLSVENRKAFLKLLKTYKQNPTNLCKYAIQLIPEVERLEVYKDNLHLRITVALQSLQEQMLQNLKKEFYDDEKEFYNMKGMEWFVENIELVAITIKEEDELAMQMARTSLSEHPTLG